MTEWTISFAITGCGSATVEASSKEEALEKFNSGICKHGPQIDDWDTNRDSYRGGYIDVTEES